MASSHPSSTPERCQLMSLSPELRNYIYELVLVNDRDANLKPPVLTRVSREIWRETLAMSYGPLVKTLFPFVTRSTQEELANELATLQPNASAGKCHLLSLPTELRNRIHELVLVKDNAIPVKFDCGVKPVNIKQPALTRVSRQTRNDSLPIFYGQNTFLVHLGGGISKDNFAAWLNGIGARTRLLRCLRFALCHQHAIRLKINACKGEAVRYQLETGQGQAIQAHAFADCFVSKDFQDGVEEDVGALGEEVGLDGFGPDEYIQVVQWFK